MLRCEQYPPSPRPFIGLVQTPDLRAGFGRIHAAILSKGGQLRPDIARRTIVGELKGWMFERLVSQLQTKRTVQALHTRVGSEHHRQELLQAAVLPGAIESRHSANEQHAPAQFAAEASQH